MEEQAGQQKYAVLIDGDNAQASLLTQILAEVSKEGLITIKRIYGDWTTTYLATMGNSLRQLDPAFDPRTYGHQKLQSLLKDYPETFILKQDRSKRPPVVNVALMPQVKMD